MTPTSPLVPLLIAATLSACGEPEVAKQSFAACQTPIKLTEQNPKYVWTPNAIRLVSKQVAPRVFVVHDSNADKSGPAGIPLATSGGFVVGDDSVLMVESMINRQLFCQMISLVQEKTNKPIRYVVNTSSHGDHSYGNYFLPKDIKIVQHQRTAAYIAAHFPEDVAFMKMNFGTDQGLDEIAPVAAHIQVRDGETWSQDLGGIVVEARYHGFAQTGGDLFVQTKGTKVLWTGNALVAEKPALPWLLDGHGAEVEKTLAQVKAGLPTDTVVVPGHSHPLGMDAFQFSIDYLSTLRGEVDAAVQGGLTVEQTVAKVTMDKFQGYALWGWVHSMVNVPVTYKELKK